MSGRQHQARRPAYRTVRAETLLDRLARIEFELVTAVIELRDLGRDLLADSLNTQLGHVRQIHTAATDQLRIEVNL